MNTARLIMLALLTALALAACGDDDGGSAGGNNSGCAVQPNFQSLHDNLFSTQTCANSVCHGGSMMSGMLSLDSGAEASFAFLVNAPTNNANAAQRTRVVPGDSAASYLFQVVATADAPSGRMPLGGSPLPECQQDAIRTWIDNGATR